MKVLLYILFALPTMVLGIHFIGEAPWYVFVANGAFAGMVSITFIESLEKE